MSVNRNIDWKPYISETQNQSKQNFCSGEQIQNDDYCIQGVNPNNTGFEINKCSCNKECSEAYPDDIHEFFFLFEPNNDNFCIVAITKEQSEELYKEEMYWDNLRDRLKLATEEKNEKSITKAKDDIEKELRQLRDNNKALIEIVHSKTKKISYVKSDVICEPEEKAPQKKETPSPPLTAYGQGNFTEISRYKGKVISYEPVEIIKNTEWNKNERFDKEYNEKMYTKGKIDSQKIKDQLTQKIGQIQMNFPYTSGNIAGLFDESWGRHLDDFNNRLQWSKNKYKNPKDVNVDFSAHAQLFRYYAGASLGIGYDPTKGKVGLKGEAQASLRLLEGRAQMDNFWPNEKGHPFIFNDGKNELDLGFFRSKLSFDLSGFLGASCLGSVEMCIELENRETLLTGGAKLFAGIEIGVGLTGAIEWDNPEKRVNGKPAWSAFFTVGYCMSGNFGVLLEANLKIGIENDRFIFKAKAGAAVGAGFSGMISGTIDAGSIWTFIQFIYHKLKDTNFSFLNFIEREAFIYLTKINLYIIEKGEQFLEIGKNIMKKGEEVIEEIEKEIEQYFKKLYKDIDDWWRERSRKKENAENLAERINNNSEILKYTTPEAKGIILYTLTPTFVESFEESQEEAILSVLSWIQTYEEYYKVCNRMTEDGEKIFEDDEAMRWEQIPDYEEHIVNLRDNGRLEKTSEGQLAPLEVMANNENDRLKVKNINLSGTGHTRIQKILDGHEEGLFYKYMICLKTHSELIEHDRAVKQNNLLNSINIGNKTIW